MHFFYISSWDTVFPRVFPKNDYILLVLCSLMMQVIQQIVMYTMREPCFTVFLQVLCGDVSSSNLHLSGDLED